MDGYSFRLLKKYDAEIVELDLSNKQIEGILCLKKFTKLSKLDCSYNQITSFENLPASLTELICYENKIFKLDNLPDSLETLNCASNKIKYLDNLPKNLINLYCVENQKTNMDELKEKYPIRKLNF